MNNAWGPASITEKIYILIPSSPDTKTNIYQWRHVEKERKKIFHFFANMEYSDTVNAFKFLRHSVRGELRS